MNESVHNSPRTADDDYVDIRELLGILWAGKWLIAASTFVAALIAIIAVLMLPNIYRAEALLAPNAGEGAGELSALAARYGGLASLAGVSLGSGTSDRTALGLEILKSRRFVAHFVERRDILVPLMAAKMWDPKTRELIIDRDIYDPATEKWVRKVDLPRKPVPSSQEAYKAFSEILSASQNKKSGFVTIAVEHLSPDIAKQWNDWLIEDLNSSIMQKDVAEANRAIEYLNEQIKSTSLADLKEVFFRLIEEQTKKIMLANVTEEYLLKTIDPAVSPEDKSKPRRGVIVVLCTFFGLLAGLMAAILTNRLKP